MSTVTAATAATYAPADSTRAAASQDSGLGKVANQETFLQLLVAQIRNQNPLNPADSVQFVSQLAQFSELEQIIGIRAELASLLEQANGADTANGSTPQA